MTRLIRAGVVVALLVLLGRLSGFAREWLIAVRAGASSDADVAVVLLTFPDLMVGLLLGGGLSAALVPRFVEMSPGERSALLVRLIAWIGGVFLLFAVLVTVFAQSVLKLLLPGMSLELLDAVRQPFTMVSLALPLAAMSGIAVAFLNAGRKFVAGASGTLVFNGCLILMLLLLAQSETVTAIVVGVLAGAVLRLSVQLLASARVWQHPEWSGGQLDRRLLGCFAACFGFSTLLLLMAPLARAFASYSGPGGVALFNFAHKLVELPMGVVIGVISTVMLPVLATSYSNGGFDTRNKVAKVLRLTLQCALAISIPVIFFSDAIVRMAFFKASFTQEQFAQLGMLACIGFVALPFQALMNVLGTTFAAIRQTRPLVITGSGMLLSFFLLAKWALAEWQLLGLMGAYVIAYAIGVGILSHQLARHLEGVWRLALQSFATGLLLPTVLSASLAAYLSQVITTSTWRLAAALLVFLTFSACMLFLDPQGMRHRFKLRKDVP